MSSTKVYYPPMPVADFDRLQQSFYIYLMNFKKDCDAILTMELYLSFGYVMEDWYMQNHMSTSLWIPLEFFLYTNSLTTLGVSNFEHLNFLVNQSIAVNPHTNIELDSTGTLVRPKWAGWSQVIFQMTRGCWNGRRSQKKKRAMAKCNGKMVIQEAMESVKFNQQHIHEPCDVQLVTFAMEKDGCFTAAFNVPGIPSLIMNFLNGYSKDGLSVSVIEYFDSVLFVPAWNF